MVSFLQSDFLGVWRGCCLHPGPVRGEEQVHDEGDLLSHDLRHRHSKRSVRLRRGHWRHHREQPQRLRPLLNTVSCVDSLPNRYLLAVLNWFLWAFKYWSADDQDNSMITQLRKYHNTEAIIRKASVVPITKFCSF